MVESVDTRDLKSLDQEWLCGFKSRFEYVSKPLNIVSEAFSVFRVTLKSYFAAIEMLTFAMLLMKIEN